MSSDDSFIDVFGLRNFSLLEIVYIKAIGGHKKEKTWIAVEYALLSLFFLLPTKNKSFGTKKKKKMEAKEQDYYRLIKCLLFFIFKK